MRERFTGKPLGYADALRQTCAILGRPVVFRQAESVFKAYLKRKRSPRKDEFFMGREWQELRYRAFVKYGRQCLVCGNGPRPGKPLHVDHIKPRSTHPELQWELDNLQILCEDCNFGKGTWDETDWRSATQRES